MKRLCTFILALLFTISLSAQQMAKGIVYDDSGIPVGGVLVSVDGDFPSGGLHAAVALAPDLIMCYANGRDKGYSEGVIYEIDPVAKTATYRTRIVLPAEYSSKDRSNMQKIGDDLYFMNSTVCGKAIFVNGSGEIRRVISRSGISYRAYYFSM